MTYRPVPNTIDNPLRRCVYWCPLWTTIVSVSSYRMWSAGPSLNAILFVHGLNYASLATLLAWPSLGGCISPLSITWHIGDLALDRCLELHPLSLGATRPHWTGLRYSQRHPNSYHSCLWHGHRNTQRHRSKGGRPFILSTHKPAVLCHGAWPGPGDNRFQCTWGTPSPNSCCCQPICALYSLLFSRRSAAGQSRQWPKYWRHNRSNNQLRHTTSNNRRSNNPLPVGVHLHRFWQAWQGLTDDVWVHIVIREGISYLSFQPSFSKFSRVHQRRRLLRHEIAELLTKGLSNRTPPVLDDMFVIGKKNCDHRLVVDLRRHNRHVVGATSRWKLCSCCVPTISWHRSTYQALFFKCSPNRGAMAFQLYHKPIFACAYAQSICFTVYLDDWLLTASSASLADQQTPVLHQLHSLG